MKKLHFFSFGVFFLLFCLFVFCPGYGDSLVSQEWVKTYQSRWARTRAVALDPAGNIYVAGTAYPSDPAYPDDSTKYIPEYVIIKYDPDGNQQWLQTYPNTWMGVHGVVDLEVDASGNVYALGCNRGEMTPDGYWGADDYLTIKYTTEGEFCWARIYNGYETNHYPWPSDVPYDLAVDSLGNSYVTGAGSSLEFPLRQGMATVKYDAEGNTCWVAKYFGSNTDWDIGQAVGVDSFGNVYVSGSTRLKISTDPGYMWGYEIIKYTPNGEQAWVKEHYPLYNVYRSLLPLFMSVDDAGNSYLAGLDFESESQNSNVSVLIKYDTGGALLWEAKYNDPNMIPNFVTALALDTSGNAYLSSSVPTNDISMLKYDALGNRLWASAYDGSEYTFDRANDIALDTMGNAYITGHTFYSLLSSYDFLTVRFNNSDGSVAWAISYDGVNYVGPPYSNDDSAAISVTEDGDVIVAGSSGPWWWTGSMWTGDAAGEMVTIKYKQDSPPIAEAAGPYLASEGTPVMLNGAGSTDLEGDIVGYAWDLNGDDAYDDTFGPTPLVSWPDNLTLTVGLEVTDSSGQTDTDTADVTIGNLAPVIVTIATPIDPVPVNTPINAGATFTDAGVLDTHTAVWSWGDGTTSSGVVSETNGSGSVTGTHSYSVPGVYTVTLTITDDDGGAGQATSTLLAIYNPEGGFVTGAGLIESPPGAYSGDPSLTGNAHFAFVSRYQKGATAPTGQTQFRFQVADLSFNSNAYEWLVVAGARAQFKGTGTIDNVGGVFKFMIVAIDGQMPGGGGVDKFRIKIWDQATEVVIYDNQMGASEDGDPSTAIKGGNIVIHKE